MSLTVLKLHVFLELHAVTPSPARLTFILSVAFYFLFPLYFPLFCPPLFNCFFVFVHCLTSFDFATMCLCPCLPFFPMFLAFSVISQGSVIFWRHCGWWVGQKHVQLSSMERRWMMMIRGYVWLAPPPKKTQNPFNKLIQSVLWPLNRSVETIPLYDLSSCSLT